VRLLWFSDRTWRVIAFAAAAVVRLARLGRADLWTDEIQTLHVLAFDGRSLVEQRLRAGHLPAYFVFERGWCSLFGASQTALRAPAALFGLAALVPAWSLLRRLAGERAAWWGTAILAFHPLLVELSREARMYSLLALVTLVVADRAAATLEGERPGASFWIAVALAPLVHPTWAFAALPLAAWVAYERRSLSPEARRASRAALVGVLASVAALVVALAFAHAQRQTLTRRPWSREAAVFALRIFTGSDLSLFHAFLPCAAVVGIWSARLVPGFMSAAPRVRRFALAWALGVPAASLVAGAFGVPWGPARYVQTAAIGFCVLAAVGCAAQSAKAGRQSRAPLIVLLCATIAASATISSPTPWSDAAAVLRDDPSIVVVDDEPSRIVLGHYLGREVRVRAPPSWATSWRHARLVVEGGVRRVEITPQTRSGEPR
jgi:hypothetical protein